MLISIYDSSKGISVFLQDLKGGYYYLNGYMTVLISHSIITSLRYSKEHEGSWIYESLPINNKGNIYSGMFKAATLNILIPIYLIMGVMFILLFGVSSSIHVFIMFLGSILSSMILFRFSNKELPFAKECENSNTSEGIASMFSSLIIVGVLFGTHLVVKNSYIFMGIYLLILMLLIKLSYRNLRKVVV